MGDKSNIEWTDATWNPVTGCSKVSEGCRNCYAKRDWPRISANPKTVYHGREFEEVRCHPERLNQPLRWKRPRRIFVNSMSDLFHPAVSDDFLNLIFSTMEATDHAYQILTKRPERMKEYLTWRWGGGRIPRRTIWLGVSVEDQKTADERIPLLLQTPAAVRWISAEPLLGPIDLISASNQECNHEEGGTEPDTNAWICRRCEENEEFELDWVVVGGESGPGARPCHPDWVRSLRDQCVAAGVPFFFKQWGEFRERTGTDPIRLMDPPVKSGGKYIFMTRVGKKNAGRLLDGREWSEFPEGVKR